MNETIFDTYENAVLIDFKARMIYRIIDGKIRHQEDRPSMILDAYARYKQFELDHVRV